MRPTYVLPITILLFTPLLLTSLTPPTRADQTINSIVDADITATYTTGTTLHVTAQLIVRQINDIFGTTYTQQQIESGATGDDIVAIKLRLRDSLNHQLQTSFPHTQITPDGRPTYANPYFTDMFTINLTSAYFQQPTTTNITPLITGLLDTAASITYHYPLTSEPGWNTTYHLTLPTTLSLTSATSDHVTADQHTITWTIDNHTGTTPPQPATLSLHQTTPTTPAGQPQNITIDFTLDTRTPSRISLTTNIQINTLDLTTYPPLPSFITGVTTLPADSLRLLTTNHLLNLQTIQNQTVQPLMNTIQPLLKTPDFNQTLTFTFTWDPTTTTNATPPYNLTHMDTTPPLNAQYIDPTIRLTINNLTARAYFGLINAGATATINQTDLNFGTTIHQLTTPTAITLILPQNITCQDQTTIHWTQTTSTTTPLHSDVQPKPPYTQDKRTTSLTIDIPKLDLDLPTLFTGRTQLTATTRLTENDNLYIITTPPTIHLPPSITITYLNSDAYRLCHEEGLLTDIDQDAVLHAQQNLFENRVTTILNGRTINAQTNTRAYTDSLQWNSDIATMDATVPIILSTYADDAMPLGANLSISPAAFDIAPLHFTLPHSLNASATYRIIFPPGLAIASIQTIQSYAKGNTSDGRAYIEFEFNQTNQTFVTPVTCYLEATPLYVLTLFLPLILMIVLLVILIVIILLIRKHRKKMPRAPREKRSKRAKKREKTEQEEDSGSEDAENFYVPPAPRKR